jgi:drug/metabolite transporter (DMT)-like permease
MFAALLTSIFFALSAVLARQSAILLGSQRANLARQLVALFFLGLWAHLFGQGLQGSTLGIMVLSGMVGFGVGDWALFEALPRIGSALTILLCQCLAAPIAALTEWLWLGTVMTPWQLASSAVILLGVALAVAPGRNAAIPSGHRIAGIIYGLIAAAGQAWGAVLSRYAFERAAGKGVVIDGITAAYQRLWGGVIVITVLLLLHRTASRWMVSRGEVLRPNWRRGGPWMLANAVAGPMVGVSCYQWALKSTPSALVLPIIAVTPLEVMLLAFAFEDIRPTGRAIAGSIIAVVGVCVLMLRG